MGLSYEVQLEMLKTRYILTQDAIREASDPDMASKLKEDLGRVEDELCAVQRALEKRQQKLKK